MNRSRAPFVALEERDSLATRVRPSLVAASDLDDEAATRSARESYVALEELGHAGAHQALPGSDETPASSDSLTTFRLPRSSRHDLENESVTSFRAAPSFVAVCENDADVFAPTALVPRAHEPSTDVHALQSGDIIAVYEHEHEPAPRASRPASAEVEPLDLDALKAYLFDEAPAATPEPTPVPLAQMTKRVTSPSLPPPASSLSESGGMPIHPLLPRLAEIQQVMLKRQRGMSILPEHELGAPRPPMASFGPTMRSAFSSFPAPIEDTTPNHFSSPTPSCPVRAFTPSPSILPDAQMPDSGFHAWTIPTSSRRGMPKQTPQTFKLTLTALFVGMTAIITLAVVVLAIAFVRSDNDDRAPTSAAAKTESTSAPVLMAAPPPPPPVVLSSDDIAVPATPVVATPSATPAESATPRVAHAPRVVKAKVEKTDKVEKSEKSEKTTDKKPAKSTKEKSVEQQLLELGEEQLKNTL